MSTTITITLPGVAGTGAICEWLLVNYPQATAEVTVNDTTWTHAAPAATETGPEGLVADIVALERSQVRQWRLEARQWADERYDDHISVVCPKCEAQPTQPCARPNGQYHRRPYVHQARSYAWRNPSRRIDPWVAAAPAATNEWHSVNPPTDLAYCMCGHLDEVHHHDGSDHSCVIDGCSCPVFEAVTPIFRPITLDEM